MRTGCGLVLVVAACGGAASPGSKAEAPLAAASASGSTAPSAGDRPVRDHDATEALRDAAPASPTSTPCIVVGAPASVEGVLRGSKGLLALRLTRPRCVVGLPRAGFVTEVAIASAGPDLRPLVDAPVRITGDVIAGENDMGGPALVVLAKDIERSMPTDGDH